MENQLLDIAIYIQIWMMQRLANHLWLGSEITDVKLQKDNMSCAFSWGAGSKKSLH